MMKKKILFLLSLILLISFMVGCTNVDISDLGLVMAVGIDKGKKEGSIMVTVQVALPSNARSQTGAPSAGGKGEPVWTASAEGNSIFEAIRNVGRFSSRRLFWAHNYVIVINDDYARDEGISDVIDFFTRNNQLRMNTWVVVTPDKAQNLVATKTGLEVIPGRSIDKLFRYNRLIAEAPSTDMKILTASYMSSSSHPVLAKVQTKSRGISTKTPGEFGSTPQVELSGAAVFNRDKMVGWLNAKESRGLLWFIEKIESAVIALECPTNKMKPASVELKENNFEVKPSYKNGKPSFSINITSYGELVELGCSTTLENPTIMADLEKALEKELKEEIEKVINKAQKEYKVDFIKLGESFENKYPAEWKKIRSRWKDIFPEVEISVHVNAEIKSPALLENPTRSVKD